MNTEKNITNNEIQNIIIFRKPINKIMNLDFLKKFSKNQQLDSIITLYSSKKSYISPKLKLTQNKKIDNKKEIKRKISPNQNRADLENKNIKNNLYNHKVVENIKDKKSPEKEIKKYNYKKKINLNQHKLNKKINNKKNNLILGSLIDNENEGTFDNNSLEKAKANKFKNFINNKINNNEKNIINRNNIFDMGSISHISKNGSSSAKDKNIEEEIKNNNAFEKIVCDFIEEENYKNLFQENESNINNKENNEDNNTNNPINQQYKSKALKEILQNDYNNNDDIKNQEKNNNHENDKKLISEVVDNIVSESENEAIVVEKFAEDILLESIAKNFVKIVFEEVIKEFKKKKEERQIILENINKPINNLEIIKAHNNDRYDNSNDCNIIDEINDNEINKETINSGANSDSKPLYRTLEENKNEKNILNKEKNNLFQSQKSKNIETVYKRITTLPGVSKNFRFGYLRKSSIRREYQQRKYDSLNTNSNEKN